MQSAQPTTSTPDLGVNETKSEPTVGYTAENLYLMRHLVADTKRGESSITTHLSAVYELAEHAKKLARPDDTEPVLTSLTNQQRRHKTPTDRYQGGYSGYPVKPLQKGARHHPKNPLYRFSSKFAYSLLRPEHYQPKPFSLDNFGNTDMPHVGILIECGPGTSGITMVKDFFDNPAIQSKTHVIAYALHPQNAGTFGRPYTHTASAHAAAAHKSLLDKRALYDRLSEFEEKLELDATKFGSGLEHSEVLIKADVFGLRNRYQVACFSETAISKACALFLAGAHDYIVRTFLPQEHTQEKTKIQFYTKNTSTGTDLRTLREFTEADQERFRKDCLRKLTLNNISAPVYALLIALDLLERNFRFRDSLFQNHMPSPSRTFNLKLPAVFTATAEQFRAFNTSLWNKFLFACIKQYPGYQILMIEYFKGYPNLSDSYFLNYLMTIYNTNDLRQSGWKFEPGLPLTTAIQALTPTLTEQSTEPVTDQSTEPADKTTINNYCLVLTQFFVTYQTKAFSKEVAVWPKFFEPYLAKILEIALGQALKQAHPFIIKKVKFFENFRKSMGNSASLNNLNTMFIYACLYGDHEGVTTLLNKYHSEKINPPMELIEEGLSNALKVPHVGVVKTLLEHQLSGSIANDYLIYEPGSIFVCQDLVSHENPDLLRLVLPYMTQQESTPPSAAGAPAVVQGRGQKNRQPPRVTTLELLEKQLIESGWMQGLEVYLETQTLKIDAPQSMQYVESLPLYSHSNLFHFPSVLNALATAKRQKLLKSLSLTPMGLLNTVTLSSLFCDYVTHTTTPTEDALAERLKILNGLIEPLPGTDPHNIVSKHIVTSLISHRYQTVSPDLAQRILMIITEYKSVLYILTALPRHHNNTLSAFTVVDDFYINPLFDNVFLNALTKLTLDQNSNGNLYKSFIWINSLYTKIQGQTLPLPDRGTSLLPHIQTLIGRLSELTQASVLNEHLFSSILEALNIACKECSDKTKFWDYLNPCLNHLIRFYSLNTYDVSNLMSATPTSENTRDFLMLLIQQLSPIAFNQMLQTFSGVFLNLLFYRIPGYNELEYALGIWVFDMLGNMLRDPHIDQQKPEVYQNFVALVGYINQTLSIEETSSTPEGAEISRRPYLESNPLYFALLSLKPELLLGFPLRHVPPHWKHAPYECANLYFNPPLMTALYQLSVGQCSLDTFGAIKSMFGDITETAERLRCESGPSASSMLDFAVATIFAQAHACADDVFDYIWSELRDCYPGEEGLYHFNIITHAELAYQLMLVLLRICDVAEANPDRATAMNHWLRRVRNLIEHNTFDAFVSGPDDSFALTVLKIDPGCFLELFSTQQEGSLRFDPRALKLIYESEDALLTLFAFCTREDQKDRYFEHFIQFYRSYHTTFQNDVPNFQIKVDTIQPKLLSLSFGNKLISLEDFADVYDPTQSQTSLRKLLDEKILMPASIVGSAELSDTQSFTNITSSITTFRQIPWSRDQYNPIPNIPENFFSTYNRNRPLMPESEEGSCDAAPAAPAPAAPAPAAPAPAAPAPAAPAPAAPTPAAPALDALISVLTKPASAAPALNALISVLTAPTLDALISVLTAPTSAAPASAAPASAAPAPAALTSTANGSGLSTIPGIPPILPVSMAATTAPPVTGPSPSASKRKIGGKQLHTLPPAKAPRTASPTLAFQSHGSTPDSSEDEADMSPSDSSGDESDRSSSPF